MALCLLSSCYTLAFPPSYYLLSQYTSTSPSSSSTSAFSLFERENLRSSKTANDSSLPLDDSSINADPFQTTSFEHQACLPPLYESLYQSTDLFLSSIDILQQSRLLRFISTSLVTPKYRRLHMKSPHYARILLQGHSLKAQLFKYEDQISIQLTNPLVYSSTNDNELPIVINTGASYSITPVVEDFTGKIQASNVTDLNQLSGKAQVVGKGPIAWNIEDMHGVRRRLSTVAYYFPAATVCLFSPQVYIADNDTAILTLNRKGLSFTLRCGSTFKFPLNPNSNLPFMLTQTAIQQEQRRLMGGCNNFTSFFLSKSLFQPTILKHIINYNTQHLLT